MTSSLIPERPLLISPTLAATIGLEEAVMLHVLSELLLRQPCFLREQRRWAEIDEEALLEALPFWNAQDIKRVRHNLQEKGLILVEAVSGRADALLIAINQKEDRAPARAAPTPAPEPARRSVFASPTSGRASYIPSHWEPSEELYQLCAQKGVPREFVRQRVKGFVMTQRERGRAEYSWHNVFHGYIIREWRKEQSYRGARELESDMSVDWRPSEDALTILLRAGISLSFIEDAVPEFVLYWRERGLVTSTWNTRFIQHVRQQWHKFNAALEHEETPRPIAANWQPNATCLEVLEMAHIDLDFALAEVKPFVLYWQDRGGVCASWNTRFLQHVKFRWANRDRNGVPAERGRDGNLERFADRSWAE